MKLALIRRAATGAVFRCGRAVLRRPQLKMLARAVLARFPGLRVRLHDLMYRAALRSSTRLSNRVQDDADLSPRTVRMLAALRHAARRARSGEAP
jgi:O-antigen chain-terminating methyltransferase